MSQGDLLMQRKQHNNGELADEEAARRHPEPSFLTKIPLRKSIADSPSFIESLKRTAGARNRQSIILTAPTSGSMRIEEHKLDSVLGQRDKRQRAIIAQRQQEEDQLKDSYDSARSHYHQMMREREMVRLRQMTRAREELQNKTLPDLSEGPTAAAFQREAERTLPQRARIEANRDRTEVNLIRRQEEQLLMDRRQASRRNLELTSGTGYAISQSTLRSTLSQSDINTIPSPEEAHSVKLNEEEAAWQASEEDRDIKKAMSELDALDERLFQEEMKRLEIRHARKKALRAASVRK